MINHRVSITCDDVLNKYSDKLIDNVGDKYILIDDTMQHSEHLLYRIVSIKKFADVKVGDIGGYVSSSSCLDSSDRSWIYEDACVINSVVTGDSIVSGITNIIDSTINGSSIYVSVKDGVYIKNSSIVETDICYPSTIVDSIINGCDLTYKYQVESYNIFKCNLFKVFITAVLCNIQDCSINNITLNSRVKMKGIRLVNVDTNNTNKVECKEEVNIKLRNYSDIQIDKDMSSKDIKEIAQRLSDKYSLSDSELKLRGRVNNINAMVKNMLGADDK